MLKHNVIYVPGVFDEGGASGAAGADNGSQGAAGEQGPEKKYTDADVDAIINKKFAKWQKDHEEKIAAAEAKARMTEEERRNAEFTELQKELDALKREKLINSEQVNARKALLEAGVTVTDDILQMIIGTDAEANANAVKAYITAFKANVETAVKGALAGKEPQGGNAGRATVTKEQILAVKDPMERQKLIKENMQLFKN